MNAARAGLLAGLLLSAPSGAAVADEPYPLAMPWLEPGSPVVAPACSFAGMHPALVTPTDVVIPRGGGIVVALRARVDYSATGESPPLPSSDPLWPDVDQWTFDLDGKPLALATERLAPGLLVLRPRKPIAGQVTIHAGAVSVGSYAFGAAAEPKPPAQPQLQAAKKLIDESPDHRLNRMTTVEAQFAAPPPATTVAIVTWLVTAKARTPASYWLTFGSQSPVLTAYRPPGRCSEDAAGTVAAHLYDDVAFSWVDEFGRRSDASKPMRVVE